MFVPQHLPCNGWKEHLADCWGGGAIQLHPCKPHQPPTSPCARSLIVAFFFFPAAGRSQEVYRNQLGSFGVSGDLAVRPVSSLSGGQKSRVAFAAMSMTR